MVSKIPKIVHYIWVGSAIPTKVRSIIHRNQKFTDGFSTQIWTDENLPRLNEFAKSALREKNWAFVSDYVRMKVLFEYGGIYLDTDQLLLKPLDRFLTHSVFAGWNRERTFVYTGIIGAKPKNRLISNVLAEYDKREYHIRETSPRIFTECISEVSPFEDIQLYESPYFYPVSAGEKPSSSILKNAYATHLWDESWVKFRILRKISRKIGFIAFYKKLLKR